MFDIPNKTSGAMDIGSLVSGITNKSPMNQQQNFNQQQGFNQQQNFNQQPVQQNYGQPQGFNQQQSFNQQPVMTQVKQRPQGNGVVLKKGQKVALNPANGGVLDAIEVGLGWDLGPNGQSYDLDVEAFMLGSNGKVLGDDWFVFYNQPLSPDGAVKCGADNQTGNGIGDDETINIRLSQVNAQVTKIVFIVTINEALVYGYNFSNVTNAYVRIVDKPSGQELIKFQLTDYYKEVCSMVVGELYRHNGTWKFNAVGNGTAQDLEGLCISYGVNIVG